MMRATESLRRLSTPTSGVLPGRLYRANLLSGGGYSLSPCSATSLLWPSSGSLLMAQQRTLKKKMEVVLTQDSPQHGVQGEVLSVARGYARNYLFQRDLAIYATPENKKKYAVSTSRTNMAEKERKKKMMGAMKRLTKLTVQVKRHLVRAAPETLHSPVTPQVIIEKLRKQHSIQLREEDLQLPEPITRLGIHMVPVQVQDTTVELRVAVQRR
ncbi:hypothetical protein QOT17_022011 [Balamuthia mandrillaris]